MRDVGTDDHNTRLRSPDIHINVMLSVAPVTHQGIEEVGSSQLTPPMRALILNKLESICTSGRQDVLEREVPKVVVLDAPDLVHALKDEKSMNKNTPKRSSYHALCWNAVHHIAKMLDARPELTCHSGDDRDYQLNWELFLHFMLPNDPPQSLNNVWSTNSGPRITLPGRRTLEDSRVRSQLDHRPLNETGQI